MKEEKSKNVYSMIHWKVMIPIMLFVIFQSAFNSFTSVLANIAKVFPEASTTAVQMIMTVPSLMSIPVSLGAGILASYFCKKHLILFALAIEFLGGIFPLFANDKIAFLILSSSLIGVGQGIMISMGSAVIGENFTGTARGVAMGLKQAASSVGIAALTVMTGYLAMNTWYHAYGIYFFVIPVFILTWIFLPMGKKDVRLVGKGAGSGIRKVLTRGCVYYSILSFFMAACNFAFYTNIGMSIISRGMGDSSSVGVASAWNSLITVIVGLIFGYILKSFKRYTLAAALLIQALAFLMMANAGSLFLISIGGMIYGLGAGMQMIAACYYILESVEQDASSMAISVCMTFTSLGVSASPALINFAAARIGELDGTTGLIAAGVGMALLTIVDIGYEIVWNKESNIGK